MAFVHAGPRGSGIYEEISWEEALEVVTLDRHPIRRLHHRERRVGGQQFDHQAFMRRIEVLDEDEGHSAARRQGVEEAGAGLQATGRGADADDLDAGCTRRTRGWARGASPSRTARTDKVAGTARHDDIPGACHELKINVFKHMATGTDHGILVEPLPNTPAGQGLVTGRHPCLIENLLFWSMTPSGHMSLVVLISHHFPTPCVLFLGIMHFANTEPISRGMA